MQQASNIIPFDIVDTTTPLMLRVHEVAHILQISRAKTYELTKIPVDYGGLPVVRIGKSVRVRRGALQRWIEQQEQGLGK